MHENVKPKVEGRFAYCDKDCPRWITTAERWAGGECPIAPLTSRYCGPWYQNRIEELEGQVKQYQAAQAAREDAMKTKEEAYERKTR